MSSISVVREPRRAAPPIDKGEFPLQEPPGLPEAAGGQLYKHDDVFAHDGRLRRHDVVLRPAWPEPDHLYLSSGMMAASMVSHGRRWLMRSASERKSRLKGERRDYLRYLGQIRSRCARSVGSAARVHLVHAPGPGAAVGDDATERLWERRANHADFAEVRIGTGPAAAGADLAGAADQAGGGPGAVVRQRAAAVHPGVHGVESMPVAVYLRGFARVSLEGDGEVDRAAGPGRRGPARDFSLAGRPAHRGVCRAGIGCAEWDWVKWLPHAQHRTERTPPGRSGWSPTARGPGAAARRRSLDERGPVRARRRPPSERALRRDHAGRRADAGSHRLAGRGTATVAIDVTEACPGMARRRPCGWTRPRGLRDGRH